MHHGGSGQNGSNHQLRARRPARHVKKLRVHHNADGTSLRRLHQVAEDLTSRRNQRRNHEEPTDGHEAGGEFLSKFQNLVLRIQSADAGWEESDTMFAFKRAIKSKIKLELEMREVSTMDKAYDVATKYEKVYGQNQEVQVHYAKQQGQDDQREIRDTSQTPRDKGRGNCYSCGQDDQREVRDTSLTPRDMSQRKCYSCGRKGHYQRECWTTKDKQDDKREVRDTSPTPRDMSLRKCNSCGRKGHYQRDCWTPKEGHQEKSKGTEKQTRAVHVADTGAYDQESNVRIAYMGVHKGTPPRNCSLMVVNSTIQGKNVTFALDTGATVSILTLEAARRLGIITYPAAETIATIGGNRVETHGRTRDVVVEIGGNSHKLSFVVLGNSGFNFGGLLGLDWFLLSGASVEPRTGSLKFQDIRYKTSVNDIMELRVYHVAKMDIELTTQVKKDLPKEEE